METAGSSGGKGGRKQGTGQQIRNETGRPARASAARQHALPWGTVAFFPSRGQAAVAERLHECLDRAARGGQSGLVQPGLFAFGHELSRAFRRPHLSSMLKNEGVDVLAAHHTTPSLLIDLANLFRNHEPAAPEAVIPCDRCGMTHHVWARLSVRREDHSCCSLEHGWRKRIHASLALLMTPCNTSASVGCP